MPTFTQQELEEIRSNTERIERERLKKEARANSDTSDDASDDGSDGNEKNTAGKQKASKTKSARKTKSRAKKSKEHAPLIERLVGFLLLLITIAISYLIMVLN